MNAQNCFSANEVGIVDGDLTVKSTGTQKRRVKDIGAVGCCHNDNAFVVTETVHFNEQLVERLLSFIVSAAKASASVTADGIDFIDENNTGRALARGFKEVAYTGGTDTNVHFNEIRTGNRIERHACFACNGFCKQSLTRTGRAYEKHAARNSRAKTNEFLGIA